MFVDCLPVKMLLDWILTTGIEGGGGQIICHIYLEYIYCMGVQQMSNLGIEYVPLRQMHCEKSILFAVHIQGES